ncbi:TerB family tellurite resistance protein [Altibacter sp.]|uniref:TerB family tellurite resistance protein n=1 Tax=Altibacter sp. TaxID=2024823 RepID=UPI000C94F94F|nr:TerB family tellurite resistance protein [Altibacter sp.]MAP54925.1 hypothetical protein [Altibacter sp.]|tara:strand:+ start:363 stop:761 length:399 start_codon:yes stop_codon:yes gene_type:complete
MDKFGNKALISDLIALARADEKVTEVEYDFIIRLAERMRISSAEVKELFENPLPSKPLLTELERITHFYKLVLVMNVDKETHEKEIVAVRNFGLKMGIRPGVVDQILLRMEEYEDKIIPSEELLKIFQTYYN